LGAARGPARRHACARAADAAGCKRTATYAAYAPAGYAAYAALPSTATAPFGKEIDTIELNVWTLLVLLAREGVEVIKSAPDGFTALMVASQDGQVEVVRLLLARQDVEVDKTEQNGATEAT
jgi:hypothetical protein